MGSVLSSLFAQPPSSTTTDVEDHATARITTGGTSGRRGLCVVFYDQRANFDNDLCVVSHIAQTIEVECLYERLPEYHQPAISDDLRAKVTEAAPTFLLVFVLAHGGALEQKRVFVR